MNLLSALMIIWIFIVIQVWIVPEKIYYRDRWHTISNKDGYDSKYMCFEDNYKDIFYIMDAHLKHDLSCISFVMSQGMPNYNEIIISAEFLLRDGRKYAINDKFHYMDFKISDISNYDFTLMKLRHLYFDNIKFLLEGATK